MPIRAWNPWRERQYEHIRERQYEHIKAGLEADGTAGVSPGRRRGPRSHRGPAGRTRDELYAEARRRGIRGRSRMSKAQLERAIGR